LKQDSNANDATERTKNIELRRDVSKVCVRE